MHFSVFLVIVGHATLPVRPLGGREAGGNAQHTWAVASLRAQLFGTGCSAPPSPAPPPPRLRCPGQACVSGSSRGAGFSSRMPKLSRLEAARQAWLPTCPFPAGVTTCSWLDWTCPIGGVKSPILGTPQSWENRTAGHLVPLYARRSIWFLLSPLSRRVPFPTACSVGFTAQHRRKATALQRLPNQPPHCQRQTLQDRRVDR